MSTASVKTAVVQYGRRKGLTKQIVSLEMEKTKADLPQVAVLSKAEWQGIQDSVNGVNRYNRSIIAAAEQREALHMRSKEQTKHWSNTIAGQRQKLLQAKQIREAIREEERKRLDMEEAKYQAQVRKEAIDKAKTQQFYQTNRVNGFHSALFLVEAQKEREAQIELKRRKQKASKEREREFLATMAYREEQAVQQEQQKALQRKQDQLALTESWKLQNNDRKMKKEQEMQKVKREAEEMKRLQDLHLWEQSMNERKKREEQRRALNAFRDHLTNREQMKAAEAKRQEEEQEKRNQLASHQEKVTKMRKEKQEEIFRERQRHRESFFLQKFAVKKQQQISNEEEIMRKRSIAVAEREARQAREQREKEEKHAAMMKSIDAHSECKRQEQKRKAEEEKQKDLEMLNAAKDADKNFMEEQKLIAQKAKEQRKTLQDTHIQQIAEKRAKDRRTKKQQKDFVAKNNALVVKEENNFQKYAKQVIETAEKSGRNILPLLKAAKEGIGGGLGPMLGGLRPSHPAHESGVQMPNYVRGTTQNIKQLNKTDDFQLSKKRLGLIW